MPRKDGDVYKSKVEVIKIGDVGSFIIRKIKVKDDPMFKKIAEKTGLWVSGLPDRKEEKIEIYDLDTAKELIKLIGFICGKFISTNQQYNEEKHKLIKYLLSGYSLGYYGEQKQKGGTEND